MNKIKDKRIALGLTQHQLAELTDIPFRTIQNWETGQRKCPEYVERLLLEKLDRLNVETAVYHTTQTRNENDMDRFKTNIYFHMEKGANLWEIEDQAKQQGFTTDRLRFLGYEVEMEVEIFKDGSNQVVSIMGVDVSDKKISI